MPVSVNQGQGLTVEPQYVRSNLTTNDNGKKVKNSNKGWRTISIRDNPDIY